MLDRLVVKWRNAAAALPAPVLIAGKQKTRMGVIAQGGVDGAVKEALDRLADNGVHLDYLRIRGFPFHDAVEGFIEAHDLIFVVEQNRDAQLKTLLIAETEADKAKLVSVLDYAGMPANPRFIVEGVSARLQTEEA